MLRLVSFSMDYYWACNRAGLPDVSMCDLLVGCVLTGSADRQRAVREDEIACEP